MSTPRAETPQSVAGDILSTSSYQRQLPSGKLTESRQSLVPDDLPEPGYNLVPPEWLYDVATVLVYCLLGAAVIGLAVYAARLYADRSARAEDEDTRADAGATGSLPVSVADPTLREADALAADGRFADAVHLLLAAALAYLRQRVAPGLADSLTSREVINTIAMPEERRNALLGIVGTVEISHFGGRPVDGDGYGRCRALFAALTGLRASGA